MSIRRLRRSCVLCGARTAERVVLELPPTPLANEFVKEAGGDQEKFPLRLQLCPEEDCGHLQLEAIVEPERLFRDYVYVSGTSKKFVEHFDEYAASVYKALDLHSGSMVVDVGSNDGTLLKAFKKLGVKRVFGFEPASKIADEANRDGVATFPDFFDRQMAFSLRHDEGTADLVTANNVFAHIDDLETTALAVCDILSPDGVFVFEVSYLRKVVEQMLFDTIYHEHLSYHAVRPLLSFFESLNMTLFHVEMVGSHGGSIRCFVSRRPRPPSELLKQVVKEEEDAGLFKPETYRYLGHRIQAAGAKLAVQISAAKDRGGKVCGYGAPAKLTTLMHAFGLNPKDFDFIVDDSAWKQGLYTPGMHIPVVGRPQFNEVSGKGYTSIVFAWNFFDSIITNNASWSGTWINPITSKTVVSAEQ